MGVGIVSSSRSYLTGSLLAPHVDVAARVFQGPNCAVLLPSAKLEYVPPYRMRERSRGDNETRDRQVQDKPDLTRERNTTASPSVFL